MKNTTFYILSFLLFSSISLFSQEKFERTNLDEKYYWNNSTQNERNKYYFGIDSISSSKSEYHFRYEKSSQIIDLKSDNGVDFTGQITNIIQENKEIKTHYGESSRAYNYLFEKKEITVSNASKAGRFILNQNFYSIPTDSLIKNWKFGWFDCSEIKFDFKVNEKLYQKNYTCLKNQNDSVEFVIEINKLTDNLNQILDLKNSYDNFKDRLPKGKSYTINGSVIMYIMTASQSEGWKNGKPIRDYKKSIKVTIDNYLEKRLNELIPNSAELKCYDDFSLTFTRKGKLKSIKVDMKFWERIFDKD